MHLYFTQIDPPGSLTVKACRHKGWTPIHHPFREAVSVAAAPDWSVVDAVIITSARAAHWYLAQENVPALPLAVVGAYTASLLPKDQILFKKAPANASELARLLGDAFPEKQRYLFLCGRQHSPVLADSLGDQIHACVVYETRRIPQRNTTLQQPNMVYFQAPSTVADFHDTYGFLPETVAAIGPSTAQALNALGRSVQFQPSRPERAVFLSELPHAAMLQ